MAVGVSPLQAGQSVRLKCLHCATALDVEPGRVACGTCGHNWPIREGVVRISEPAYYWGEMARDEARRFVDLAERDGWRDAVRQQFADPALRRYVLDPQRTSWASLLGLGRDAVALDIGSGYGAITHALSRQVAEVYSLEAIPERIEFTRIRLAQENISNVRLVQGSALQLPMLDGFFDLVVANGVLEWVGEWTMDGDPRDVQLRFLSDIQRMLKPNGTLVIGIENRIGFDAFRGSRDHSGVPYTSLMPRWLASAYLRLDRRPHHRTALNAKRQYRTYTYSESGYRRLLSDSGFPSASFYWADPGYNEPYALVPLCEPHVRDHMRAILDDPDDSAAASRSTWRRQVKRLWVELGLVRPFVSGFVIMAQKRGDEGASPGERLMRELRASFQEVPGVDRPVCELTTRPFNSRNLIKVFAAGRGNAAFVVKASTPADGSKEAVANEFRSLALVHGRLGTTAGARFSVPHPIGSCTIGHTDYTVESGAAGRELWRVVDEHVRQGRVDLLRSEIRRCIEVSIELTQMLKGEPTVEHADPAWWELPDDFPHRPDRSSVDGPISPIAALEYRDCVQHGDYTAANIFVDPPTGRITLIDWEHTLRGLPPLYDSFALLISLLPVVAQRQSSETEGSTPSAQLRQMFFEGGQWTEMAREVLLLACDRLAIAHDEVWTMFAQSLVLRTRYYQHRGSPHAHLFSALATAAWEHRADFLLR